MCLLELFNYWRQTSANSLKSQATFMLTSWTAFSYAVTWHPYLSFSGDGILKQEVCTLGFLNVVITLGGKQEALTGIVGEGWGRSGGHRLVAGIPAPVPTGRAAVAGRQALLPALTSQICTWTQNTQRPLNYCLENVLLHIPEPSTLHEFTD